MHFLTDKLEFPPVSAANEYGMLAIGGDLSTERLLLAYKNGIFPWYSEGEPIVWYSPDERMVLFPDELKISKSMRKILNKKAFKITHNKAFKEVIFNCKTINRKEEFGTWITDEMEEAYINLHQLGIAKSIEVWQINTALSGSNQEGYKLVGGLYGLEIGTIFCGESMFSKVSNASKVAFISLAALRSQNDVNSCKYQLVDCQMYNDHLASLGAREIEREDFLKYL